MNGFKIPLISFGLFGFPVKRDVLTGLRVKSGSNFLFYPSDCREATELIIKYTSRSKLIVKLLTLAHIGEKINRPLHSS